jgi:hypothetical protein
VKMEMAPIMKILWQCTGEAVIISIDDYDNIDNCDNANNNDNGSKCQ